MWTSDGSGVTPIDPIRPPVEAQSADTVVPESNLAYLKTYTYDLAGNRTSFTVTQDGAELQKTNYLYDDLNRLTAVYANGGTQAAYTYDTNGNRASLTYANGVTETYRYNKANWVILLENRNKKGVISSYAYTYYASGSQKTKTTAGGTVTSYVYDGLNRLIQEAETGALTQDYTYDARGNRAQMTVSGKASYSVSYSYDANNRLLTERKTRGLLTDLTTYAYDANGSLLSKTFNGGDGSLTGATYTYNLFNQLSTAAENGLIAAYAYNAQGIRTCKATATSQTYFLLDGGNVVGEHVGSKTVTYLRGANLISRSDANKTTYYLFNAHGDVTELVSDSSTVTHKYDYDAFGVEKKPDPLDGNPFRYCGEYFDGETKTYYLRARYYDPNIGRFTQQDTHWNTANSIYGDNPQKINERGDKLGLKSYSYAPQITAVMQSGNLYVYGVSNPTVYMDRDGRFINTVTGFLIGGLIGGINAAIDGKDFWKGAAIGAVTGAVSGFAVDMALATGGIAMVAVAAVVGAAASGAGNAASQMILDGKSLDELDKKSILTDALVGGACNLLSFGVSGGSLKKVGGSLWTNMKKNAVNTLMEGTTKTVSQSAVKKTTKVISTKAGKAVVRKTTATVVKKVAQNAAKELATTAIISGSGALASRQVQLMLM